MEYKVLIKENSKFCTSGPLLGNINKTSPLKFLCFDKWPRYHEMAYSKSNIIEEVKTSIQFKIR